MQDNNGQQPDPSSHPSRRTTPSKKDRHGGGAAIPLSVPSVTLAAANAATANAANAAAVAAANPCIPFIAQAAAKAAEAAAVAAANHRAIIKFYFALLGDVFGAGVIYSPCRGCRLLSRHHAYSGADPWCLN